MLPVIVTEHAAKAFGPTIEPVRAALQAVTPLHKMVFSCFGSAEFRAKLESLGRKQVVVAGYETHVCVCQTALSIPGLPGEPSAPQRARSELSRQAAAELDPSIAAALLGVLERAART